MLPIKRVLRCICAPVHQCGSCFIVCGEICCEVVKNPAFLVVFIILCIHSTILISYFTFANTAKPKAGPAKPNPIDAIMALPEYNVYLRVANDSAESVHIGSEDFRYPLLVDMVQLVSRVRNRLPVSVAPINRHDFRFPINQPALCTSPIDSKIALDRREASGNQTGSRRSTMKRPTEQQQQQPLIVLVVKSALAHFEQRQLIRDTWGNFNCWPTAASTGASGGFSTASSTSTASSRHYTSPSSAIKRVFMVGRPKSNDPKAMEYATKLALEVQQHGDVVQADFIDHYFNNTLKMMASFSWMIANCQGARYAFFLDDDYVINPLNLIRFTEAIPAESYAGTMAGFVWRNAAPVRKAPKRNPQSRWLISFREYPWSMYPAYVSAGAFLVSMPIIRDFTIAMEYTRYLRFDDVFLGILMHKLRIMPLHAERIHSFSPVYPGSGSFSGMIASHGYASKTDKVRAAWSEILNRTGAENRLPLECVLSM